MCTVMPFQLKLWFCSENKEVLYYESKTFLFFSHGVQKKKYENSRSVDTETGKEPLV